MRGCVRRHSGLEIRDERMIQERSFPDWSMELVRVNASYFDARDSVESRIPASVSADVRDRLDRMTKLICATIDM